MNWKQRTAAALIWSTSAYGIGTGINQLTPANLSWVGLGAGGVLALWLILEAGRR